MKGAQKLCRVLLSKAVGWVNWSGEARWIFGAFIVSGRCEQSLFNVLWISIGTVTGTSNSDSPGNETQIMQQMKVRYHWRDHKRSIKILETRCNRGHRAIELLMCLVYWTSWGEESVTQHSLTRTARVGFDARHKCLTNLNRVSARIGFLCNSRKRSQILQPLLKLGMPIKCRHF